MITLRMTADVKDDRRVVLTLPPEVPTGQAELVVSIAFLEQPKPRRMSMLEFLETLPPGPSPRCFPTWEEYERHLQEEKNEWER